MLGSLIGLAYCACNTNYFRCTSIQSSLVRSRFQRRPSTKSLTGHHKYLLENVEHYGVEPEQADTGVLCH